MSLSRLNHRLSGREAHPEVVQGTTDVHHQIADALLPQADPVFDDATALDTTIELVASFVNRSNLLKLWEKTETCEVSA
jgi:hypothetical protein